MKKFGINKKDKAGEDSADDPTRNRLFGSKSKSRETSAPSANPYAIPQSSNAPDPYAAPSPYAPAPSSAGGGGGGYAAMNQASQSQSQSQNRPPPYQNSSGYGSSYSSDPARDNKSPVPPGGYGGSRYANPGTYGGQPGYGSGGYGGGGYGDSAPANDRYGGNRYGDNSYGNSRYGSGGPSNNMPSSAPQRTGGYGGLGGPPPGQDPADGQKKNDLFGDAKQRYEQREAQDTLPPEDDPAKSYGQGANGVPDMGYGNYQDRELTAEEQEEEDVQATKQQIRAIKQQDVSSTRNALRIAEQAEETGRETLERLGQQGERIHNTERNLDLASNQNRLAEDKARELKHLNRSMWAMRVGNPFTKERRDRERDDQIMSQHQSERDERQATRQAAYESQARQAEAKKELFGKPIQTRKNLAERSKYQFEADSEDEAMEDEIDGNLEALQGAAGRLHQLGTAMGKEVDSQNKHIDRITGKADKVDDQIVMNRSRLDRIR